MTNTDNTRQRSSIQDRINLLLQAALLPKKIRPPMLECLWRPFEWYGFSRAKFRSQLRVIDNTPDAILYEFTGYKIWWPRVADPENLVYIIGELLVPSNPHYFTPLNMKPWDPEGTVFDVGSCEGLFALRAIREFHAKQVVAIEPGAIMAKLLRETFQVNQCSKRAKVVECLLGKRRGTAAFRECLSDPARSTVEELNEKNKGFSVQIVPLDELAKELNVSAASAIKIDAEGADFEILLGAEKIIRQSRPRLMVTTYHVAEHAIQMRTWLESLNLGYHFVFRGVSMMGSNKVRPVLMIADAN